jgi:hypothetical protein
MMQPDMMAGNHCQPASHLIRPVPHCQFGIMHLINNPPGMGQQPRARVGQLDSAVTAVNQTVAGLVLKSCKALTDGRLGNMKPLSGL